MLAGPGRLARFEDILRRKVWELDLPDVHFTGHKMLDELAALYRRASLLVTASDWESYCVPLVEAMSVGLPIVARATTVMPETLGDAGLKLPPEDGPEVMAEAWCRLLNDDVARKQLAVSSADRFAEIARQDPVGDLAALVARVA
jgi:glycosyltransferase involved in cell wall biosynthesis